MYNINSLKSKQVRMVKLNVPSNQHALLKKVTLSLILNFYVHCCLTGSLTLVTLVKFNVDHLSS